MMHLFSQFMLAFVATLLLTAPAAFGQGRLRGVVTDADGAPLAGVTVLVQGTLDMCFVEDGKWVLVDYKTDRSGDESEILARYGTQLNIYRRALEQLTGREVKHTYICLLSRNRRLEV